MALIPSFNSRLGFDSRSGQSKDKKKIGIHSFLCLTFSNKRDSVKPPPCVVNRKARDSLTRRPQKSLHCLLATATWWIKNVITISMNWASSLHCKAPSVVTMTCQAGIDSALTLSKIQAGSLCCCATEKFKVHLNADHAIVLEHHIHIRKLSIKISTLYFRL